LTQSFGSKEQLSAVRLFIEMNRTDDNGPFQLMTTFPKKVFTDEDYDTPLDVLGMLYINNLLLHCLTHTCARARVCVYIKFTIIFISLLVQFY